VTVVERGQRAGWYPDPTGRSELRWFDGRWTEHVSTGGRPGIDPLPSAAPAPAPAGGPRPARRAGWVALGIAALVAVVAVIIGVSAGSGGDSDDQASDTQFTGTFCTDAQTNWVRVNRAWNTADTIVERGVPVQDWASDQNLLTSTAVMARQLADEAPDASHGGVNFKQEYGRLATYLDGVGGLAAKQGGTEADRTRVGRQAPTVMAVQMDTELTVVTGLPGSVC
jgi:hypothetical protein